MARLSTDPLTQVSDIERLLGLDSSELAAMLGVADDVLQDGAAFSHEAVPTLDRLHALLLRVAETYDGESLPTWLRSPSLALWGARPIDLLMQGRLGEVSEALDALEFGAHV